MFITTKLWMTDYGRDEARRGFDHSLELLGIDTLDLWLLHQPYGPAFDRAIEA